MTAIRKGSAEVVELLLEEGARTELINTVGAGNGKTQSSKGQGRGLAAQAELHSTVRGPPHRRTLTPGQNAVEWLEGMDERRSGWLVGWVKGVGWVV